MQAATGENTTGAKEKANGSLVPRLDGYTRSASLLAGAEPPTSLAGRVGCVGTGLAGTAAQAGQANRTAVWRLWRWWRASARPCRGAGHFCFLLSDINL